MAFLLNTSLGRTLIAAGALVLAVLAALRVHRRAVLRDVAADRAANDLEAHERMNHAPDLRTASDDDRIDWLHRYADRNRVD